MSPPRSAAGPTTKCWRASPERVWKARSSVIRFWNAIRSASWPITSRWNKAPARSTPRPDTARKITWSAASTASKPIVRWMPAGRFYHAEGAAGRLPEELIGKTVWEANPIVIEILHGHHALLHDRKNRTQLSALLALPQADHLPRDRAVVHRHGPQRFPPARARRPSARCAGCRNGARSASPT